MAVFIGAIGKGSVEGAKTKHYKDVRVPIKAGMPFGKKGDYKLKKIGYEVIRQYFDTAEKDMQVGRQRIKRVINT
jgi:hypothetical protein